jgi:hypothetical protein
MNTRAHDKCKCVTISLIGRARRNAAWEYVVEEGAQLRAALPGSSYTMLGSDILKWVNGYMKC